jgi:hypothetical protein
MTVEQKYTVACALLPVLADFLEDAPMVQTAKLNTNHCIKSIRSYNRYLMDTAKINNVDHENFIQREFRNWLKEKYKE